MNINTAWWHVYHLQTSTKIFFIWIWIGPKSGTRSPQNSYQLFLVRRPVQATGTTRMHVLICTWEIILLTDLLTYTYTPHTQTCIYLITALAMLLLLKISLKSIYLFYNWPPASDIVRTAGSKCGVWLCRPRHTATSATSQVRYLWSSTRLDHVVPVQSVTAGCFMASPKGLF